MDSIVVHVMTEEMRERYDLETLWTVGTEFDHLTEIEKESPDGYDDQFSQWLHKSTVGTVNTS